MNQLQIIKVTENEFKDWALMRHELWPDHSTLAHLKEIQKLYGDHYLSWLASYDNQIIGFCEASLRNFANGCESSPVAFLEGIWVDPGHRRQKVSFSLLGAVQRWAISKGITELGSDTEIENQLSQLCHQHWGFEETERVVYFRKKLK